MTKRKSTKSSCSRCRSGSITPRDLITAEDTERWLEERGLTLDDFNGYFVRHYWADRLDQASEPTGLDYRTAADSLWDLLIVELQLSGELDRMAQRLAWRLAAADAVRGGSPDLPGAESSDPSAEGAVVEDWVKRLGCDRGWVDEVLRIEAAYKRRCEQLLTPDAVERSLASMRLPLMRIDFETVDVDSLDAVRELAMCVREDGHSMAEVASDGRYPYERTEAVLEDLPTEVQQKVLFAAPGDVLAPLPHEGGFFVHRLIARSEPDLADDDIRERVERQGTGASLLVADRRLDSLAARAARHAMKEPLDDALRRWPFFRLVPEKHLGRVRALAQQERYEFGDVIVRQGDEVDAFYLLTLGRARVVKETDRGKEIALAALRPGDVFGEAALLSGGARTATVRCSTAVRGAAVRSRGLSHPAGSVSGAQAHPGEHGASADAARLPLRVQQLRPPAGAGAAGADRELTVVEVAKGETIIREGDPPGPMFVVEAGKVRVFADRNGRARNLAFYREGDFFGELSILNESPRAASAEAVTPVRLLRAADRGRQGAAEPVRRIPAPAGGAARAISRRHGSARPAGCGHGTAAGGDACP